MNTFDLKNSAFALGGSKLMAITLDITDLTVQLIVAILLAIVGATASFFWRMYVLDPIKKKKEEENETEGN